MELEKILLAAFFSALAGFITAVLSIVKLVNEKEHKTSEFRQMWTNSVRASLSDLIAKLGSVSYAIEYQLRLMDVEGKLLQRKQTALSEKRIEDVRTTLLNVRGRVDTYRHDLYQSYSLCRLHFKPNDPAFHPIEETYEKIRTNNIEIKKVKSDKDRDELLRASLGHMEEIVSAGRNILKGEWERVKAGESAYKNTKKYSLYGGIAMFTALVAISGTAAYSASHKLNAPVSTSLPCWKLQTVGQSILSFNSCTGEVVEQKSLSTKTSQQPAAEPTNRKTKAQPPLNNANNR